MRQEEIDPTDPGCGENVRVLGGDQIALGLDVSGCLSIVAGAVLSGLLLPSVVHVRPAEAAQPWIWAMSDLETVPGANETPCPKRGGAESMGTAGIPPAAEPKVKLAALEISFTCEAVKFEVSSDTWLAPFAEVQYEFSKRYERLKDPKQRFLEKQAGRDPDRHLVLRQHGYAFDGKLTVFAGGKVEAGTGTTTVDAKAGGYVTVDGGGNVKDAGIRAGTSMTVGVEVGPVGYGLEVDGPGASISLVSSK